MIGWSNITLFLAIVNYKLITLSAICIVDVLCAIICYLVSSLCKISLNIFICKLVLTLLYRREYRSMENIAAEYGVSRDTIADNIHWVERALLNANLLQNSVTCVYKTN